jgi:hypothetical protein
MQYPSPEAVSPLILAQSAGMSKQAMNAFLESLEALGYLVREADPTNGRAQVVRLTKRGQEGFATMRVILADIAGEWAARLGPERSVELKQMLREQWRSCWRAGCRSLRAVIAGPPSCPARRRPQHHRKRVSGSHAWQHVLYRQRAEPSMKFM